MQKRLIATFMVALMLLTVLSAVSSANDISVSKETDEDKNSLYLNLEGVISRIFMFGTIYNLSIENDSHNHVSYDFESDNLWCFRINIDWGTYGWRFDSIYHRHKHHTFIHIGGYKFRGIITPNFICGYFYNNWFNR